MKALSMRQVTIFLILFLSLGVSHCGFKKVATKTSAEIFYDATPTIDTEDDVELAQQASLGFLKMLEGFYLQNPKDKIVLLSLTRAYAGYAYGFTENELLATKGTKGPAYDKALARANRFYSRAKRYGVELLQELPGMGKVDESTLDEFQKDLNGLGPSEVENLFWIGFAWGNYLNFNKDSVEAIASLPKVEAIMKRVLELDASYYYGGPYLFMGALYGSRPKLLGGNPPLAKENFEKAIAVTDGKNLMARVAEAQYYAVQVQNLGLYKSLLQQVAGADASALPQIRLMNELAKIRAKILLDKKSLFFTQAKN